MTKKCAMVFSMKGKSASQQKKALETKKKPRI